MKIEEVKSCDLTPAEFDEQYITVLPDGKHFRFCPLCGVIEPTVVNAENDDGLAALCVSCAAKVKSINAVGKTYDAVKSEFCDECERRNITVHGYIPIYGAVTQLALWKQEEEAK